MARTRPEAKDVSHQTGRDEVVRSQRDRRAWVINRATWVFWLMFAINMLNYLDRLIAVAVGPTLKTEFNLKDSEIGVLSSAFLLVYTLAALPLGMLADRVRSRARVVALGVGLWSVFSGLTALARGFISLLVTRAAVGVGEASYYPAGTALLSNYFHREARARVMGRWQAGQLVGALAAFALAGALFALLPVGAAWRAAFVLAALPGLALAALMWFVADAPPDAHGQAGDGLTDGGEDGEHTPALAESRLRGVVAQIWAALRIPSLWVVIALQAIIFTVVTPAITFLPIYVRSHTGPYGLPAAHAAFLTGLIIVGGGLIGTLLGGPLADWMRGWFSGARVLAAGVGLLVALPCFAAMLLTTRLPIFCVMGVLAVMALNLPAGPLTAIPQDVAPQRLRATVVAVAMVMSHLLGDVWSPAVVGALSTKLGEHLGPALLVVGAPALALGALIALIGARIYARNLADAPDD
jgi:MFS transporter, Spinster family, sphingosine-1-phosphate transporter